MLFKKGRVFRSGKIALRWDFEGFGVPQFCITTFKKSIRLATDRNRMRRLAREFFRKNQKCIKPKLRVVLQLGEFSGQKFSEFETDMKKIFKSAKLVINE